MSLLVHKSVTGLPYHAVLDGEKIKWVNEQSGCTFSFGVPGSSNSIEPLFELFEVKVEKLVPDPFKRSFLECGYTKQVPWSFVIPKQEFKERLKAFVQSLQEGFEKVSSSSYAEFFIDTNELFQSMVPCKINKDRAEKYLLEGDNHVLKSMLDMSVENTLPIPVYNRVSTKTGRMVIKKGPQILTLKKEFRSIFVPRNPDNRLYEIDFVSLEPRVALNIAKRNASSDVYSSFVEYSEANISRDTAKLAILCALYGAGKHRLDKLLKEDGSLMSASQLLFKVKKYFSIDNLSRSLVQESKSGKIANCFGRPIEVDDARNTMLINNFLQSSAVDVALLGFTDFCKRMGSIAIPLFIIHDALVFEASPEHIDTIAEYVNNGFDIKNMGNFPLKLTEFGFHE